MDWPQYKALCDRPDVMPRAVLVRTETLLPEALAHALRQARDGAPFPKPADHKGGGETDMFEVPVTSAQAAAIVEAVEAAADAGRTGRGVVAAWRELLRHAAGAQEGGGQASAEGKSDTRFTLGWHQSGSRPNHA